MRDHASSLPYGNVVKGRCHRANPIVHASFLGAERLTISRYLPGLSFLGVKPIGLMWILGLSATLQKFPTSTSSLRYSSTLAEREVADGLLLLDALKGDAGLKPSLKPEEMPLLMKAAKLWSRRRERKGSHSRSGRNPTTLLK